MFAAVDARVKAPFLIVETGQPVRSMRRYGGFPHWIRVAAGLEADETVVANVERGDALIAVGLLETPAEGAAPAADATEAPATEAPAAMTYSSVVSRESVRLAYLIAALHDLELTSADISNAYLHAPCKEKIWFQAGAECGEHRGKVMIVTRALYGLKSAGASWRSMLSTYIVNEMSSVSTRVDPDVYRQKSVKPNGEPYYELLLVYVDDILLVSAKPEEVFKQIASQFTIKDDHWGPPHTVLGIRGGRIHLRGRWTSLEHDVPQVREECCGHREATASRRWTTVQVQQKVRGTLAR